MSFSSLLSVSFMLPFSSSSLLPYGLLSLFDFLSVGVIFALPFIYKCFWPVLPPSTLLPIASLLPCSSTNTLFLCSLLAFTSLIYLLWFFAWDWTSAVLDLPSLPHVFFAYSVLIYFISLFLCCCVYSTYFFSFYPTSLQFICWFIFLSNPTFSRGFLMLFLFDHILYVCYIKKNYFVLRDCIFFHPTCLRFLYFLFILSFIFSATLLPSFYFKILYV